MTARRPIAVWCLVLLASLCVGAQARAQTKTSSPVDPVAAFDRGVQLLEKDPFAAKARFEDAAAGFERLLSGPLSQADRAHVLYNLGASRQLAGDHGRAVLALRRAELLAPATAGLRERLAAARATARGDVVPPTAPGLGAGTKGEAEFDAWGFARDWALSVPRLWLWWCAIAGWVLLWTLVLLRAALPEWMARPGMGVLTACLMVAAAPAGMLVVHELRERAAEQQVVVMKDLAARTEPDDLTGGLAPTGTLKAGAEMRVMERRVGGNGEEWLRVRPLTDATDQPGQEPVPLWLPRAAVEAVSGGSRPS